MISPKATTAAILERDGKILITKRTVSPYKGSWCIPGGHIERFEPVLDAIKREVKEETGLSLKPEFFGFFNEIFPEIDWHAVVMVFSGQPAGDVTPNEEVSEWKWVSPKEASGLNLAFGHNNVIDQWIKTQGGKKA